MVAAAPKQYGEGMSLLPDISASVATGELGLVIGPRAERVAMLELSATLALHGAVRVLDGGNSYNALYVARYIRRHTVQLDETLNRITLARAFTCYQMVSLLQETAVSPHPTLILDLLATFYDESVAVQEAQRLLRQGVAQLNRLRRLAPVIVSLRPPPPHQPDRAALSQPLEKIADHLLIREPAETAVYQPSLFQEQLNG
jgi:hypothetical protein